jgi:hypothetical protein
MSVVDATRVIGVVEPRLLDRRIGRRGMARRKRGVDVRWGIQAARVSGQHAGGVRILGSVALTPRRHGTHDNP